jgi:GNAT superfamily N-acetyltransferase
LGELPFALATGVVYVLTDVPAGAAICCPLPIPYFDAATEGAPASPAAALGTDGAARFDAVVAYVEEHLGRFVPPPASYLPVLDVHPAVWGCWIGTALIHAFFARAAADHLPACWVTWTPRNVAFYRRTGDELVGEGVAPGADQ